MAWTLLFCRARSPEVLPPSRDLRAVLWGSLDFHLEPAVKCWATPTQCCDLLKPQFAFLGMRSLDQSLIYQLSCSVPVRVPGEPIKQRIKQRSL